MNIGFDFLPTVDIIHLPWRKKSHIVQEHDTIELPHNPLKITKISNQRIESISLSRH